MKPQSGQSNRLPSYKSYRFIVLYLKNCRKRWDDWNNLFRVQWIETFKIGLAVLWMQSENLFQPILSNSFNIVPLISPYLSPNTYMRTHLNPRCVNSLLCGFLFLAAQFKSSWLLCAYCVKRQTLSMLYSLLLTEVSLPATTTVSC